MIAAGRYQCCRPPGHTRRSAPATQPVAHGDPHVDWLADGHCRHLERDGGNREPAPRRKRRLMHRAIAPFGWRTLVRIPSHCCCANLPAERASQRIGELCYLSGCVPGPVSAHASSWHPPIRSGRQLSWNDRSLRRVREATNAHFRFKKPRAQKGGAIVENKRAGAGVEQTPDAAS